MVGTDMNGPATAILVVILVCIALRITRPLWKGLGK